MSKTWGSLYIRVCLVNTAGCTPGYMHGEIQRSISSASSLPFSSPPPKKEQTIAARQSITLAGGYLS